MHSMQQHIVNDTAGMNASQKGHTRHEGKQCRVNYTMQLTTHLINAVTTINIELCESIK